MQQDYYIMLFLTLVCLVFKGVFFSCKNVYMYIYLHISGAAEAYLGQLFSCIQSHSEILHDLFSTSQYLFWGLFEMACALECKKWIIKEQNSLTSSDEK